MNRFAHWFVPLALFVFVAFHATPAEAMPMFIPIIIAAAAYAAGYITLTALVITVVTAAASFLAQSLLTPSGQSASSVAGTFGRGGEVSIDNKQTTRQPLAPRKVVYGTTRMGGTYAYLSVAGTSRTLYMAIMFAGHLVDAILGIWFADEVVTLDGSGMVIAPNRYQNHGQVIKHNGEDDQISDAMLRNNPEWTTAHRLRGIAYIAVRLLWNDQTPDPNQGTKIWSGIPNITALVRGRKLYDPRDEDQDPLDKSTWLYSSNSALCVADYLCDPLIGLGVDYATGINEDALIAAANACDEEVLSDDMVTMEPRYSTDGSFATDARPNEVLGRLLGAMHGEAIRENGQWIILAGVYQTPTITITDSMQRQGSTVTGLQSVSDSCSGIKGTFIGADNDWQSSDFKAVRSDLFKQQDGDVEKLDDIELPFTKDATRARRIATIELLERRQEIGELFRGNLSCWKVLTGTTIFRDSVRYGWTQKPFRVKSVKIVLAGEEENPQLGVDLTLRETAPELYDYTASLENYIDPAPNTNWPDYFTVYPPTNLQAVESLYVTRIGGGAKAKLHVTYDPSEDDFVRNGGTFRSRYRLVGDPNWTLVADTEAAFFDILDIDPGLYQIETVGISWSGAASPAATLMVQVLGLAAAPITPQNFEITSHDTLAYARFSPATDLDVIEGGYMVIKHSSMTDGSAVWSDTLTTICEALTGNSNQVAIPLVAGTYLAKFRDSSGTYSDEPAVAIQFQTSVHEFTLLAGGSSIQDPAFAGVKTGTVATDGVLRLDGVGDFDDVADTDALVSWDYTGEGVMTSGSYAYDAVINLGAVKKFRLTNAVSGFIENIYDDFDSRTEDSDSWASWDGEIVGDEATTWLEVETTQTNPAIGIPVWSAPVRIHSATFEAWGVRLTRQLRSEDGSFTPAITADAVVAEAVV